MRRALVKTALVLGLLAVAAPCGATETPAVTATPPAPEQPSEAATLDLPAISKSFAEQAARLRDDAAGRDQRLQELAGTLKKNPQSTEAADELVLLLQGAAQRLAPDAEFRTVFSHAETVMRSFASESEASLEPDVRKKAEYYHQRVLEIAATKRAAEEARTRLWALVDRQVNLKERPDLNKTQAVAEFVKGAQLYLDEIRLVAAGAQRLAVNIENFAGRIATQPEAH